MNYLSIINNLTNEQYLEQLRNKLVQHQLLDHNRNLTLANSSDRDLLEMFFLEKVFPNGKQLSPHTIKAYNSDAKTLLEFLLANSLSFQGIGFPEVKAYNKFIVEKYSAKSAKRKLNFFRRLLDFGYETQFYKAHLSTWISIPVIAKKGHYSEIPTNQETKQTRLQIRELNQKDAEYIISFFPKIVKSKRNIEQFEKRNLLIGYLLYTTGLRASELLDLNWGSFRFNRNGKLVVDVMGKGNKPRTIPIKDETKEVLFEYRKSLGESVELNPDDTTPLLYTLYTLNSGEQKKRLTYSSLYKIVKEAVSLAGKQLKVSPHWFRHTFVTMLLENDVPLAVVKDLAGHEDISTTNIYLERINQDNMHEHLEKVDIFK